ncbi:MAG: TIGR00730 family Rossman fold protein [Rubrivivax sp.]|nr:TIGR00730 family Rossman fold protein [Rubrivivax sp.]
MNICVYCGSRPGALPAYAQAARDLGQAIASQGHGLVYGGGNVGLMGIVADAVLAAGGPVVGVIPEALVQREVGHQGLSEQFVVPDMHVRKRMMAERADAFIALPGGIGTLEELFEVWTWRQLRYHDKPIGVLNLAGFYDHLLRFMDHTVAQGFLDEVQRRMPVVDTDPVALLRRVLAEAALASAPDDYSRI